MGTIKDKKLVAMAGTSDIAVTGDYDAVDGWVTESINCQGLDEIGLEIVRLFDTTPSLDAKFQTSDKETGGIWSDMYKNVAGAVLLDELDLPATDGVLTIRLDVKAILFLRIFMKRGSGNIIVAVSVTGEVPTTSNKIPQDLKI